MKDTTINNFKVVSQQVSELTKIVDTIGDSTERLEEATAKLEEMIASFY